MEGLTESSISKVCTENALRLQFRTPKAHAMKYLRLPFYTNSWLQKTTKSFWKWCKFDKPEERIPIVSSSESNNGAKHELFYYLVFREAYPLSATHRPCSNLRSYCNLISHACRLNLIVKTNTGFKQETCSVSTKITTDWKFQFPKHTLREEAEPYRSYINDIDVYSKCIHSEGNSSSCKFVLLWRDVWYVYSVNVHETTVIYERLTLESLRSMKGIFSVTCVTLHIKVTPKFWNWRLITWILYLDADDATKEE